MDCYYSKRRTNRKIELAIEEQQRELSALNNANVDLRKNNKSLKTELENLSNKPKKLEAVAEVGDDKNERTSASNYGIISGASFMQDITDEVDLKDVIENMPGESSNTELQQKPAGKVDLKDADAGNKKSKKKTQPKISIPPPPPPNTDKKICLNCEIVNDDNAEKCFVCGKKNFKKYEESSNAKAVSSNANATSKEEESNEDFIAILISDLMLLTEMTKKDDLTIINKIKEYKEKYIDRFNAEIVPKLETINSSLIKLKSLKPKGFESHKIMKEVIPKEIKDVSDFISKKSLLENHYSGLYLILLFLFYQKRDLLISIIDNHKNLSEDKKTQININIVGHLLEDIQKYVNPPTDAQIENCQIITTNLISIREHMKNDVNTEYEQLKYLEFIDEISNQTINIVKDNIITLAFLIFTNHEIFTSINKLVYEILQELMAKYDKNKSDSLVALMSLCEITYAIFKIYNLSHAIAMGSKKAGTKRGGKRNLRKTRRNRKRQ